MANNTFITNIRKLLIATKNSWLLAFKISCFLVLAGASVALAVDYSNTNFILRNPAITVSGGRSTTATFELFTASGQIAPGQSTNAAFTYQAGFLYYGEEEEEEAPPAGNSGGSGSGARVEFLGRAYPNQPVILLKDAQIVGTVIANGSGNFSMAIGNLSPGDYLFSLYGKDYSGKASRLVVIPVIGVQKNITVINNILIPPTLSKDKKEVAKGDAIKLFGQSYANAAVTIFLQAPLGRQSSVVANAGADGKYEYVFNTAAFAYGEYMAVAEATWGNVKSASFPLKFIVSDKNVPEVRDVCPLIGDLNKDCAVNLVDFSILIYWFEKPDVPAHVDLDGNARADLVDFSIMAYYWTG